MLLKSFIFKVCVYVGGGACMNVNVYEVQEKASDSLELDHPAWILELEPRFSARAIRTFNH